MSQSLVFLEKMIEYGKPWTSAHIDKKVAESSRNTPKYPTTYLLVQIDQLLGIFCKKARIICPLSM